MPPRYFSKFLFHVKESAKRLGIDVSYVDKQNGRLVVLSKNGRSCFFGGTPIKLWPFNSALSMSVTNDKELTYRILNDSNIKVPKTYIGFADISRYLHLENPPEEIYKIIENINFTYPIVVKPNNGKAAEGISIIHEKSSLKLAADIASSFDNAVLIQDYIHGKDYRAYALRGEPILLIERSTSNFLGDGKLTVSKLFEKNKSFLNKSNAFNLSLKSFLLCHNDVIYSKGCPVPIYPVSNLTQGGKVLKIVQNISDAWKNLCTSITEILNLDFAAIDCRVSERDPNNITVIEVNSNPGIEMVYDTSVEKANSMLDSLILEAIGNYSHFRLK